MDDTRPGNKPLVLIAPTWAGRNAFALEVAEKLADLGYAGFALDMYGNGQVGTSDEHCASLMMPLMQDRSVLRERLLAGLNCAMSQDGVDTSRVAIIGYCFGGLCALDLARSGAAIKAAVSFHGLLGAPALPEHAIQAKVLVLHGYDDPWVKPEAMCEFADEMTQAGVDWQIHAYGHTKHAFTNPQATDPNSANLYNPTVALRAWQAMLAFFGEVLSTENQQPLRFPDISA